MTKLTEVFSKNSGIIVSDIDKIETGILHENHEIEITDIDNYIEDKSRPATKKERKKQNWKIVSELISFLNSGRGIGLLFLGLAEVNGKIVKKGVKSIKTKEQIRSIIYSNIRSIPSNIKNFKLDVIPIEFNEGNIFIIEVENNDLDCVFYSKMDNLCYERRGDECKSISLPNFLDLLAKKNYARIYAQLTEDTTDEENYLFHIECFNEGLEPGNHILARIQIFTIDNLKITLPTALKDLTDNLINFEEYVKKTSSDNFIKNFMISHSSKSTNFHDINLRIITFYLLGGFLPTTLPVYPHLNTNFGDLKIEKKDFNILMTTTIYEKRGLTSQILSLSSTDKKIKISETHREFKPYLQI